MASPLQIAKNATKLMADTLDKLNRHLEYNIKLIIKGVATELNTTLKGKNLSALLVLKNAPEGIEFDTHGLMQAVIAAADGKIGVDTRPSMVRIKSITFNDQIGIQRESRFTTFAPAFRWAEFELVVTLENGITAKMECILQPH